MDLDFILDKKVVIELLNGERYKGKILSIGKEWILMELEPWIGVDVPNSYRFIPKALIKYVEIRSGMYVQRG